MQIEPDREKFVNPFNNRGWLAYFAGLLPRFQYVRFLGLPSLKENPDVLLDQLYVPLYLGRNYVSAGDIEKAEKQSIEEILRQNRHPVILGDPGSGKSTLINYLTTLFASRRNNLMASEMGHMIPLPFVLRDFTIQQDVTFDDLLKQFQEQPFWPSEILSEDHLRGILENGQGLVMMDGLDEIGDVEKRKALRRAIQNGKSRYPGCIWILTSRIVGYEDVPFRPDNDSEVSKYEESAAGLENPFYIQPFNMEQIRRFTEKWYRLREADKAEREKKIASLIKAVEDSASIEQLAHNPNLLTMMALIHRVYAKLPSGRALLYDKITEAYLESIDEFRGIQESTFSIKQHRFWLAKLAYEMQEKRNGEDAGKSEILVSESEVREIMCRFLGPACESGKELSYIARRSGLLLPRKPGFYNFVHLSFQEYFAALYLYEGLMSFDRREQTGETVNKLKVMQSWHECLVFLFEKLAEHPGASDWLFDKLFAVSENNEKIFKDSMLLELEILSNIHSGIDIDERKSIYEKLVNVFIELTLYGGVIPKLIISINKISSEIWESCFFPSLKKSINKISVINPNLIIFLESLHHIDLNKFELVLDNSALSKTENEALKGLWPAALVSDVLMQEMIKRMSVKDWLSNLHFFYAPVYILISQSLEKIIYKKENFLTWAGCLKLLSDALRIKGVILNTEKQGFFPFENLTDFFSRKNNFLESVFCRAEYVNLEIKIINILNKIWKLLGAKKELFIEIRDRDNETHIALKNKSDEIIRLLENLINLVIGHIENDLRLVNSILNQNLYTSHISKIVILLLSGSDNFTIDFQNILFQNPLGAILFNFEVLLLGQGGPENWQAIEDQAAIIFDPEWIKEHFPFLTPEDVKDTFEALNIIGEGRFFKTKYFRQGHYLAPALNAKPSEFAAAVKKLMDGKYEFPEK